MRDGRRRHPAVVIADTLSRQNISQRNQSRTQRQRRAQRQLGIGGRGSIGRIVRLVVPVQNQSGPGHGAPGFRAQSHGCAICQVYERCGKMQRLHAAKRLLKNRTLALRLFVAEYFGRSEVREYPFEIQMRAEGQRAREYPQLGRSDTQPVHARLNFQMEGHFSAMLAGRRALQQSQLLATGYRWGQPLLQQTVFLAGPKARQHQDRFANAGLAQFGAFGRTSHAKPVGAGSGQRACYGHGPVAVGVTLDHGKKFGTLAPSTRYLRSS